MRTVILCFLFLAGGSPPSSEDADMPVKHRNRLADEKSPYLLQHATNPVDWHPWGDEAFERARQENKPVFLSIGYATCHWCHVMERESFEDEETAAFLNRHFISIKVDREERPDVDRIYMEFVVASTGGGGWPMSVWLTPDREPFFGGTYFPPEDKWGRKGFRTILEELANLWKTRRVEVLRQGERITRTLRERAALHRPGELHPDLVTQAAADFEGMHDLRHGGFGRAPKFPQPAMARFLLRHHYRTGEDLSLDMVRRQLDGMAAGGIYDHLGGGFARYAVDDRWLVPHFEKMLYDNAQLLHLYSETHRVAPSPLYERVIRETVEYVLRDMLLPEGGFASAEDADSEGVEGRFYVWTVEEVDRVLGEDADLFRRAYGVTAEGNWQDPHHDVAGRNILHRAVDTATLSHEENRPAGEIRKILDRCRRRLLDIRSRRTRPLRDDKILTSWNGMMIGALAHAGGTLEESRYLEAARRAARFILDTLHRDGSLLRRYREGEAAIEGLLEDHAFLVAGLLDLYEATLETEWLQQARDINEDTLRHFYDTERGGFFVTRKDRPDLIARMKDPTDGALPSPGNVAILNLIRLGELTSNQELTDLAETSLKSLAGAMASAPSAFPVLLTAVDRLVNPSRQIILSGDPLKFMREIQSRFLPDTTVLHVKAGDTLAPLTRGKSAPPDLPTAWVCTANTCSLPITDPAEIR